MRVLIVDDAPIRHKHFDIWFAGYEIVHCYGYHDTARALGGQRFDHMQLDHDLGQERVGDRDPVTGREYDGKDIAKLVAALPQEKKPKLAIVHSYNAAGAEEMVHILKDARIASSHKPFKATFMGR